MIVWVKYQNNSTLWGGGGWEYVQIEGEILV